MVVEAKHQGNGIRTNQQNYNVLCILSGRGHGRLSSGPHRFIGDGFGDFRVVIGRQFVNQLANHFHAKNQSHRGHNAK